MSPESKRKLHSLYRQATVDWPCALGDWLRQMLVFAPADFLNRLTLRRAMGVIGIVMLVMLFWQVLGVADAVLFSADVMLYLDVTTAMLLVALKEHISDVGYRVVRTASVRLIASVRRARSRYATRQIRTRPALRRLFGLSKSDDESGRLVWAPFLTFEPAGVA